MVGRLWIDVVSARRLDPDNHIAIATERQMKLVSIAHRIVIRRTHRSVTHRAPPSQARRNAVPYVSSGRLTSLTRPCQPALVGPACNSAISAALSSGWPAHHGRIGEQTHGGDNAFRRVQPHPVCQPSIAVRVVGHDQRHPPVPRPSGVEAAPIPPPVSPQRPHVRERLHMMSSWRGSGDGGAAPT